MSNEENQVTRGRIWKRVKSSTGSAVLKKYCVGDEIAGILYNTYAIEILDNNETEEGYVKVFSPDLNLNGYIQSDCIS